MKNSITSSIRHPQARGLALALVATLWSHGPQAEPAPPPAVVEALTRGCLTCHRMGAAPAGAPDSLSALYRAIVPGFADGSRIYQMAVTRHAGAISARPQWANWPSPEHVDAMRHWIEGLPANPPAPDAPAHAPTNGPAPTLAISIERPTLQSGEIVSLSVTAAEACHLTLVSVDANGAAIVLLPNDFERDNALAAGISRTVPADPTRYWFRAGKPGIERLIGWCTTEDRPLAGITHRYGTERFTILGSWRAAITGLIEDSLEIEMGRRTRQRTRAVRPNTAKPVSLFGPHAYAAVRFAVVPVSEPSGRGLQPALQRAEPEPATGQDSGQSHQ